MLKASCLVVLLAATLASGPSALAVEYGGIGGRPANPIPGNSRTESIFVHEINPGESIQDGIRLINNTAETKTLTVDAVDSVVSSGGAFACAQKVQDKKDVGAWITLESSEVTLESMTNQVVNFTLNAPASADVGEHDGCIVIQEKGAAPQEQGGGIQLSFRTGIRVAVMVPGDITRKLENPVMEISSKDDGSFVIGEHVRNTGNVSIDASVKAEVTSVFGPHIASLGGTYPILRGQTSDFNFELPRPFWGGWYAASPVVTYDEHASAGIGKASGQELTVLRGPSVTFFSMPMPAALAIEIAVLALLVALIVLAALRAAKAARIRKTWTAYEVQQGEDLNVLAQRFGVSWRLLAKVNKLKPPFVLKPGESIMAPPSSKPRAKRKA